MQERGKFLEDLEEGDIDRTDPFNKNNQLIADSVRMIGRLLDRLIDLSYGIKSPVGLKFVKDPNVLNDFKNSMAYDAFVEHMVSNQEELVEFINQLLVTS